jgi:hypothetical protein
MSFSDRLLQGRGYGTPVGVQEDAHLSVEIFTRLPETALEPDFPFLCIDV